MTELFGLLCLLAAGVGVAYLLLAAIFVLRLGGRAANMPEAWPSVTVLKPLHGAEAELFENLSSFCRQHYHGALQIVCGVQSNADPAIAVVRQLQAAFPSVAIDLVINATMHGSNRKVSNLINMAGLIRHDMVVLADSDIRVGPDYLARLAGELAQPGAGAVTCLYHGAASPTLWSRLSALSIDTHFLPAIAAGLGLGLANPCFGSTIALRRATLEQLGGFEAVADDLADDYELGAAVRRLGLEVTVPAFTVAHACLERSFPDLYRQELRWTRTIRQIEPAGHAGSILTHPFAFALLALALDPGPLALAIALAALLVRLGLCLAVEHRFGLRRHPYWLVPARDLLSFGLFLLSFLGRGVSWRGRLYGVTPRGILISKPEP